MCSVREFPYGFASPAVLPLDTRGTTAYDSRVRRCAAAARATAGSQSAASPAPTPPGDFEKTPNSSRCSVSKATDRSSPVDQRRSSVRALGYAVMLLAKASSLFVWPS